MAIFRSLMLKLIEIILMAQCRYQYTYIKETNNGSCLNYTSICPDRYKKGVIMNFLHRAYLICNSWQLFHCEVIRIK